MPESSSGAQADAGGRAEGSSPSLQVPMQAVQLFS
jgi:hypothetical protein